MKTYKHKKSNVEARELILPEYGLFVNDICIGLSDAGLIENDKNWIKQVEKDYEILELRLPNRDIYDYKEVVDPKNTVYEIYSVKRLDDGQIFSIDDLHETEYLPRPYKINRIVEKHGEIWFDHDAGATRLSRAIQVTRKPVLTSEDGVELFEGDNCSWTFRGEPECRIRNAIIHKSDPREDMVYFSTPKAAEKYRVNNAQMLSYEEATKYTFLQLKELVKSRLL